MMRMNDGGRISGCRKAHAVAASTIYAAMLSAVCGTAVVSVAGADDPAGKNTVKEGYGALGATFGGRVMRGKAPLYQVTVIINPQSLNGAVKTLKDNHLCADAKDNPFDPDDPLMYTFLAPPLRPGRIELNTKSTGQQMATFDGKHSILTQGGSGSRRKRATLRDRNLLNLTRKLSQGDAQLRATKTQQPGQAAAVDSLTATLKSRNRIDEVSTNVNTGIAVNDPAARLELVVIKVGDIPVSGPIGDHDDLATLRKHRNLVRYVKADANPDVAYIILEPAAVSSGDKVYVGLGCLKPDANVIGQGMFNGDHDSGYVSRMRAMEDYEAILWHSEDGKSKAEVSIDTLPAFTFGVKAVENEKVLDEQPDPNDSTKTVVTAKTKSVQHYPFSLDVDTIVGATDASRVPHRFLKISADPVDFQYDVPLVLDTKATGTISSDKLDTGTHVDLHFMGLTPVVTHASFMPAFFDMNVRGNQDWTYSRWEALFGVQFAYLPDTSGERWFREKDVEQAWHASIGMSANQWWLIDKRFDDAGITAVEHAISDRNRKAVYARFPMSLSRTTSFNGLDIDFAYTGVAFPDASKTGGYAHASTWNSLFSATLTYKLPKTSQAISVKWQSGKGEDNFYIKSSTFSVGVKSDL